MTRKRTRRRRRKNCRSRRRRNFKLQKEPGATRRSSKVREMLVSQDKENRAEAVEQTGGELARVGLVGDEPVGGELADVEVEVEAGQEEVAEASQAKIDGKFNLKQKRETRERDKNITSP
mmetsp:Transcript_5947/g.14409  ORF Transcript_5947/g.14409 Transcript_5947/m.14409 type:complete len:120 (+) Transcript_5947:125-484(+)